ncbi:hypothetical protein HZS_4525 [Henneguya salminicola]|nr:hypothetical protein HZS_4525 [Henneguya salminicola]
MAENSYEIVEFTDPDLRIVREEKLRNKLSLNIIKIFICICSLLFGLTYLVPIELFNVLYHNYKVITLYDLKSKPHKFPPLINFPLLFSIARYLTLMSGSIINIFVGRKLF